jgi:hypothetical protein
VGFVVSGVLLFAALLVPGSAGCGNPERYEGWSSYTSERGYRVRFPDPPWRFLTEEGGEARFEVPSNAASFAVDASIAPPKHLLRVTTVGGLPSRLAAAEEVAARRRRETIIVPPRALVVAGETGSELITRTAVGLERRYAFLVHPRGALRLELEATTGVAAAEVTALIQAVEVLP